MVTRRYVSVRATATFASTATSRTARSHWPRASKMRTARWWARNRLGAMSDVTYDSKAQYKQIESGLLDGEQIIAVYDAVGAGTGFIGLTTRRVIIQDKSFVGKRVAITSIPYSKISSVSVVSNKSWAGQYFSTGTIALTVGTHIYEVEFRGSEKTHHVHNVILHYAS